MSRDDDDRTGDLFDPPPPKPVPPVTARHTDPDTSHEAAAMVNRTGRGSELQAEILACLRSHPGGLTSRELADVTELERVSVSPQLKPMESVGLVRRDGRRLCPETGVHATVWKASAAPTEGNAP